MIILGLVLAASLGIVIFTAFPLRPVTIFAIVVVGLIAALFVTMTWWRVSADHRGFTTRGALGWPLKRIPLADIRTVQVVDVQPVRDFGGYGWRWIGGGQSGVVLRAGPGVEITSAQGKRFVVTVDDAETGAGVIAALLTQATKREA